MQRTESQDNRPRIAIVGPTPPYRGGISQYTVDLTESLKALASVDVYSFSRQYPRLLYPGTYPTYEPTDFVGEFHYTLDSNNPLSWRSTANAIIADSPEVVFINWWTLFWQPTFWYLTKRLQKAGITVIFLCHNLVDHDASKLKRTLSTALLRAADGYLVHSQLDAAKLAALVGETKPIASKSLPSPTTLPQPTSHKVAKPRLEVLFAGFIRPYKGLDLLVDAYASLPPNARDQIQLTVVGEVWGDKDDLIERLDQLNIRHDLRYVSDQELVNYINEADLVVLPYKSASGSAVIPLAYHLQTPVLATSVGGISDVVTADTTGWLVQPNSQDLAAALQRITPEACAAMGESLSRWNAANTWDALAATLLELAADAKAATTPG